MKYHACISFFLNNIAILLLLLTNDYRSMWVGRAYW